MKLELITEFKLRAELSFEDMECLGFSSYENVSDDAVETIIGIADERLGFHCAVNDCKINVYPYGDGCEIYITKSAGRSKTVKNAKRKTVLAFDNADNLINACAFIALQNISESECRYEISKTGVVYYLIVEHEFAEQPDRPDPYWLISVSELCCNDPDCKRNSALLYLCEHSEPCRSFPLGALRFSEPLPPASGQPVFLQPQRPAVR